MTRFIPRTLLLLAIAAGIALPGEVAYIGAYVALGIGVIGFVFWGWQERSVFGHPVSLAILTAIALICATLPFVYSSPADLMAPVFVLPMLVAISLGMLGRTADWPSMPLFLAWVGFVGALCAAAAGTYEHFVLGVARVGLGNNPIHYGSLSAMAGGLSMIGIVATKAAWRYIFLLGPILGLSCAVLSGSRGPLAGAVAIAAVGLSILLIWNWRDRVFRIVFFLTLLLASASLAYLITVGDARVLKILSTATAIFQFTGGSDDIRAALYASAVHIFSENPFVGVGFGQIMHAAQQLYPEQAEVFTLDNLHADWANFLAMSGGMGVVAWFLMLISPLLLLLDPLARGDCPLVLGALLLVTGQVVLGISNAMFGVLPQTVSYAVIVGYLLARAQQLRITTGTS